LLSHICTFARGEAAFAHLHGISASHVPLSPCQHAPLATFGRVEVQPSKGTA